jgi:uncharacterized membrane protein YfcA
VLSDWGLVAGGALAFFLGGFVKGVTAMGLPLVAVPVLALFADVPTAVPLMAVPTVVSNVWQVHNAGTGRLAIRRFWPILVAISLGTWLGAAFIAGADKRLLSGLLGVVTVAFVTVSFTRFRPQVAPEAERWMSPLIGFCSGVLGGLTSIFGPPLAMYLLALRVERNAFVGGMGVIMLAGGGALALALSNYGLLGGEELLASVLACIPSFAGLYAGGGIRNRVSPELFQRIVLIALLLIGFSHLRALL